MTSRAKLIRRTALAGAAAVLVIGVIAPVVNANQFQTRVTHALERSLGRKVSVGDVHFNVFTGPGFTIENVVISEDSGFGIEPFAHVTELQTRVSLWSLWTGRLEFSRLRLIEPSVNLVRRSTGGLNLLALADRRAKSPPDPGGIAGLPAVEVRSAKIFFKVDDTKSAFYLMNTDLDVYPRSGGRDGFDVRFAADPARTDRTAQGFATLRGRAQVRPNPGAEATLNADLQLERTPIDEIVRLVRGQNFGVHGFLISQARIFGPLSALKVKGNMRIEDVHRWDLMPRGGAWALNYSGLVDWRRENLLIEVGEHDNPDIPIATTLRLDNYSSRPRWAADVKVRALAAQSLLNFSRHLGAAFAPALAVTGELTGEATYDPDAGWHGLLALSDSDIKLGDTSHLRAAASNVRLDGDRLHFGPAVVSGDDEQSAEIEVDYRPSTMAVDLRIRATSLAVAQVQSGSGHLLTAAAVPFMEELRRGRWTGWLRYQAAGEFPGTWTGRFDLRDVTAAVPGVADPVRLRSAAVELDGSRAVLTHVRARAGSVDFSGDYRYEPADPRPHRFNLVIPAIEAAELERLLMPSLHREQGFIARTLRWRPAPPPDWLRERRAEGTLRIANLSGSPADLHDIRSAVVWDGTQITLTARTAKVLDGTVSGIMMADLSTSEPQYQFEGNVTNADFQGGKVDLEGTFASSGTGIDFLSNFHATGVFQARSVTVLADNPVRSASGSFELSLSASGPILRITGLQAAMGAESFSGQAATQGDGTIRLDLASAHRTMRFIGPLTPLRLDPAVAKP